MEHKEKQRPNQVTAFLPAGRSIAVASFMAPFTKAAREKFPRLQRSKLRSILCHTLVFIGTSNELGQFESGLTAQWFGTQVLVTIVNPHDHHML
jgi:hypothetical protein